MDIQLLKRDIGAGEVVYRDEAGRYRVGHQYLPTTTDAERTRSRKAFLDAINGPGGEKRLLALAEIAEGARVATVTDRDGEPIEITPSIREQLDANTTLLYLQHGRPSMSVDVNATHSVKVRWNPDKYENLADLEKLLELQRIGETVVEGEVTRVAALPEGQTTTEEGEE